MALQHFTLPDPGEGLTEAEITTWKVKVGDEVAVNDIVIEVETAKSLVELPIPFAGKVVELLAAACVAASESPDERQVLRDQTLTRRPVAPFAVFAQQRTRAGVPGRATSARHPAAGR